MSIIPNEPIFDFFSQIAAIPRCSGHEKAISDYLVKFAKSRNLEVIQDSALNVIIKKPGTKGYENAPGVIIQGHMDMVCDKNKATVHDFEKDPIKLRVEGDMLYAQGTTLGADNGMAIAYALALLSSDDIPHPPLEVLITTEEETGMDGAMAVQPENLKGKYLINIDAEEEGKLFVSCAGGIMIKQSLPIIWEDTKSGLIPFMITIRGLKGGHSGMEIHTGRGNANKLMGRVLNGIMEDIDFYIGELNGGFKANAIPREADALILINAGDENILKNKVNEWDKIFKNELRVADPGVSVNIEKADKVVKKVFSRGTMKKAIALLVLIPNGVQSMSMDIKGLVESSTNLGVVTTTDDEVIYDSAARSSVSSLKYKIANQCRLLSEFLDVKYTGSSDYPGWEYDPNSKLRDIFVGVYQSLHSGKPQVVAIHAGLECGLFKEKMPHIDMISFGPNLYDVHTPDEHASISSVKRTWEYLIAVLKEIR